MTNKADQWVYMLKTGSKKPKRIKLNKLLNAVNRESYTKQFFVNEKDVNKYIGENNANS